MFLSFRNETRLGLTFLLTVLATLASAGRYKIAFTGGDFHYTEDTLTRSAPYYQVGQYDGATYYGGDNGDSHQLENSSSCGGTLTATCTWEGATPNEAPPETVVVREQVDSTASVDAAHGVTTSLHAATGVSGETTYSGTGMERAQIVRYVVKHNAQQFTLTCAPEALAVRTSTSSSYFPIATDVSYQVALWEPKIALTGGLGGAGSEFLIGQRLTATVPVPTNMGLTVVANGTNPAYQWSMTGGDPFKEFYVGFSTLTGEQVGEKRLLTVDDWRFATLKCNFGKPGDVTVKCASLHLQTPAGAQPASGLDVLPRDGLATATRPLDIEDVVVALGQIELKQPKQSPETPGQLGLGGTNGTTGNKPYGINYRSSITTPQNYWSTYPGGAVDKGGFRWVQIEQAGTTRTLFDGTVQREVFGPENRNQSVFWTFGLDTVYPYEPSPYNPMPNTFVLPSTYDAYQSVYIANGGKDANGNRIGLDEAGDTPGFALHRTDAWTGTSPVQAFHARDDFTVYQIYRPPGADSQFVPVQSFHWWWEAEVSWFGVPGQELWVQPFPPFNAPHPMASTGERA